MLIKKTQPHQVDKLPAYVIWKQKEQRVHITTQWHIRWIAPRHIHIKHKMKTIFLVIITCVLHCELSLEMKEKLHKNVAHTHTHIYVKLMMCGQYGPGRVAAFYNEHHYKQYATVNVIEEQYNKCIQFIEMNI